MTANGSRADAAIVEILQREGVQFLSCFPDTPVIDAAARASLRPILCRQERVGVGIADGFSRVSNATPPGVFAMQWGPGVENAYVGIATAFSDSVPLLLLPLGYDQERADGPRVHSANRLARIAKSVERVRRADDVPAVLRRAFSRLRNGRPGPVVVELPADVAAEPLSRPLNYESPLRARAAGDPRAVEEAASLLVAAQRPVVVAGQGVLYADATEELITIAEFLDAGVATSLLGKSAFPEHHPLALGTGSFAMAPTVRDILGTADVVLAVGTSLMEYFAAIELPERAALIHVTNDESDLNQAVAATCPVLGDAKLVLSDLMSEVRERRAGGDVQRGMAERIESVRRPWLAAWQPLLTSDETPINPYRVVAELNAALSQRQSIVTHDSGSPRDQLTPFYVSRQPRSYLGWGRSHALGAGLGLIMGAKLARPEAVCVYVMGDAAFGMVGMDFETAVRSCIPILVVVLNNSTMAVEKPLMPIAHERYGAADFGGHYTRLAQAMDGWAQRVERPDDISKALAAAIEQTELGSPALLEIVTSPEPMPVSCGKNARHIDRPDAERLVPGTH
jgi:thiamine pyrophosphate-dependent acetolactate synthase large subunit-like protein